jgi:hypothetical protein
VATDNGGLIVGIAGKSGAGKDTAATVLVEPYGFRRRRGQPGGGCGRTRRGWRPGSGGRIVRPEARLRRYRALGGFIGHAMA